jgi:hypothetical protein
MVGVVDADTHIVESEGMWNYVIEEEMYPRRCCTRSPGSSDLKRTGQSISQI